jgi:DNA-binding MarR family transcriptional regulator
MSKQYYRVESYGVRNSVGYLVKRAHGLCLDLLEPKMAEHGLTFVQFALMMMLRDNIALNPKDICISLRHDSGALTRVIDQLEARSFVERRRSVEDRRAIELHLTEAGQGALREVVPLVVDNLNEVLSGFSHAEVEELLRLLNKLVLSLEGSVAGASGALS